MTVYDDCLRQIFVFKEYNIWNDNIQAPISSRYQEILRVGGFPLIIDAGANMGFLGHVRHDEARAFFMEKSHLKQDEINAKQDWRLQQHCRAVRSS